MSFLQPRCITSMGRGCIGDRMALMNTGCLQKILDTFIADKYFIALISQKEERMLGVEYACSMIIGCEDDMEYPLKHMRYVYLICETLGKPTMMGRL